MQPQMPEGLNKTKFCEHEVQTISRDTESEYEQDWHPNGQGMQSLKPN